VSDLADHPRSQAALASPLKDISAEHQSHLSWRRIDDRGNNVTEATAHLVPNRKSGADGSDVASVRNVTGKRRKLEVVAGGADDRKAWTLSTSWMLPACMDKDVSWRDTSSFGLPIPNKLSWQSSTTMVHLMPVTRTATPKRIAEPLCRHSLPIPPTCDWVVLGLSALA
jgi:hypothetical protein